MVEGLKRARAAARAAARSTRTKRPPLLTDMEIGMLMVIHNLVLTLKGTTQNEVLKGRMNQVFDMLPYSQPDGLTSK